MPYFWSGLAVFALGILALLAAKYELCEAWWIPGVITSCGGVVLLPSLTRAFKRPVPEVLSDHLLIFAAAFFAYFIFGALLLAFGPQAQIDSVLNYYPTDAAGALRVTAVNFVGFGIALVAGAVMSRKIAHALAGRVLPLGNRLREHWVIAAFLLLGVLGSLITRTAELGMQSGLVPGIVQNLSKFSLVAVFIAFSHRGPHVRALRLAAVVVTAIESTMGLLLFNKSAVLLPLIALAAGLGWRYGLRRVAIPTLAAMVILFLLIGGATSRARSFVLRPGSAALQQRAAILTEVFLNAAGTAPEEDYHPWARFCYVPAQVAALDYYDAGNGGDDLNKLAWAFAPRSLFPEKPVMTQTGADFHFKITGGDSSSTGQGVFANGYYNLGWPGVLLFSLLAGLILAQTSAFAREVLERRALPWLPVALLGAYMAFRIDGAFLADYWGPCVMLLYVVGAGAMLATAGRARVGDRR